MKVKQKAKRVVSGLLTAVTLLSTVLSPINSYAAELPKEKKLPLLEEVQSLLDEDEIVLAKDHQVEVGTSFDVKTDFTGLEIKDAEKVKITFEEAKNEQGEDFTTSHADTYKTVYHVEPVNQEHPNYQISRNVTVKEIEKESESPSADAEQSEIKETEEDEEDSEKPSEIPTETDVSEENAAFDALIEETMDQETYDEVSGLELRDVMEQAVEQGVDFNGMEPGEITTIKAMARTAGVGSQQVTIEKGPIYRYADYGLGTYLTEPYYISYGSVRATAYCIQPAKPGPGSGIYTITKLADNQALAKVCYYGTDAAGAESYFANKHRDFSSGKRFILVHMAAAYAYGSSDAPDGFVTSNEEKEFTFEYGKPEEAEVSYEFVFENEPTKVELTKTDLTTGKELPGAHLKVTDEDGNVIDEWVSTEKAHVIKGLTVGKSYMMTETKPADGYVTAESITFTVENTAEIQKQEMKDDVTKVLISKQDIAGKELPGAKLTILDEDGKVVESWTSTEEAHYIEMLPIGKYMLREETAPEGYLVAKDVEFEVKDTAEVQKVVMVDEEKPKESTPEGGKPSKDAPKTGDNTNLLLWLIVLGMSFSGVVVLGRKIKKK